MEDLNATSLLSLINMSFGHSISDFALLFQLAWRTVENARKACGEYDDLTKEVLSLHTVLSHIQSEMQDPESAISKAGNNRVRELHNHVEGCKPHLQRLDLVLSKYIALSEDERSARKLWQKVQFGNKVINVKDIREKVMTFTSAISTTLQLLSLGFQGKMERKLDRQGGQLKGICEKVNLVLCRMNIMQAEGSVMTNYTNDDKSFWRSFRRELVKEGFSSTVLRGREGLIKAYVRELGTRGVLDDTINTSKISPAMITVLSLAQGQRSAGPSSGLSPTNESHDWQGDSSEPGPGKNTVSQSGSEKLNGHSSEDLLLPSKDTSSSDTCSTKTGQVDVGVSAEEELEVRIDDENQESIATETLSTELPEENLSGSPIKRTSEVSSERKNPAILLPVCVEEVQDEDFAPEAHPNNLPETASPEAEASDTKEDKQADIVIGPPGSQLWLQLQWSFLVNPGRRQFGFRERSVLVSLKLRSRFEEFVERCISSTHGLAMSDSIPKELCTFIRSQGGQDLQSYNRESRFMAYLFDKDGIKGIRKLKLRLFRDEFYLYVCALSSIRVNVPSDADPVLVTTLDKGFNSQREPIMFCGTKFDAASFSFWLWEWIKFVKDDGDSMLTRVMEFGSVIISFDRQFRELTQQHLTDEPHTPLEELYDAVREGNSTWVMLKVLLREIETSLSKNQWPKKVPLFTIPEPRLAVEFANLLRQPRGLALLREMKEWCAMNPIQRFRMS